MGRYGVHGIGPTSVTMGSQVRVEYIEMRCDEDDEMPLPIHFPTHQPCICASIVQEEYLQ